MKLYKIIPILVLMIFLVGCAKEQINLSTSPTVTQVEEETTEESIEPTEEPVETTEAAAEVELEGTITLGSFMPLTGENGFLGETARDAITMGLEEINSQGGVNGKEVEVIFEDSRCEGKLAATAANKLVTQDKVTAIIGTMCSAETLAGAPIAEENKVVLVSTASSNPAITDSGDYIFRTWPSDELQGTVMAEHVVNVEGLKKVGLIYMNSDYNVGLAEAFKESLISLGGEVTADEKYEPDSKDFRTQLMKIKDSNPEAIYMVPYSEGGLVTKQIKELSIDLPMFTAEVFGTDKTLEDAAGSAEGVIFATPSFDETNPESKDFLEKYNERFGEGPAHNAVAANAYDNLMIVAEALKSGAQTSDEIRDYLYAIEGYPGAAGKLTIDENGDAIKDFQLMIVKGDTFVELEKADADAETPADA